MEKKIVVAVDGHSSSGKSTMAKELARRHHYIFIDTGAMYRAVTLYALRHHMFSADGQLDSQALTDRLNEIHVGFTTDENGNSLVTLNGETVENEIRGLRVSNAVSPVSTIPEVRAAMVEQQREMGKARGVVMDGRDIGTVVFPDAELKFFVTASAEIRARRRFDELKAKGQEASYEDILDNVITRDRIDSSRATSPLRQAEDAILCDSSHMSVDEQNDWADAIFKAKIDEVNRD